ncbi:MAG: FHA domain-containing protein [Proteobacteria bacterium]|nr:FHA domain-containing protein [Pseudomonadota bacterium]
MIGLFVLLGNERTKRMTFKRSPLTIGDAGENQLVLRGGEVARHHVTIELDEDERWHVTAHAPVVIAGTLHDRSTTRIPVNNGTRISLGTYTLQLALAAELALHPVEQRLLAELAAHDEASRLV